MSSSGRAARVAAQQHHLPAEALQKSLVPGRKGGVAEEDPWQQRASRVELQEQRGRLEDAALVDQDADDRAGW